MNESNLAGEAQRPARARLAYAAVALGAPLAGYAGIFGFWLAVVLRAPSLAFAHLAGPWSGWVMGRPEAALAHARPGLSLVLLALGVAATIGAIRPSSGRVRAACLAGCLVWSTAWGLVGLGPMFQP